MPKPVVRRVQRPRAAAASLAAGLALALGVACLAKPGPGADAFLPPAGRRAALLTVAASAALPAAAGAAGKDLSIIRPLGAQGKEVLYAFDLPLDGGWEQAPDSDPRDVAATKLTKGLGKEQLAVVAWAPYDPKYQKTLNAKFSKGWVGKRFDVGETEDLAEWVRPSDTSAYTQVVDTHTWMRAIHPTANSPGANIIVYTNGEKAKDKKVLGDFEKILSSFRTAV